MRGSKERFVEVVGLWGRLEKMWVELCRGVEGDEER